MYRMCIIVLYRIDLSFCIWFWDLKTLKLKRLWKCNFNLGDDGNTSWGSVMESKKFDEFVSDIYFDANVDDKIMVASSGEGNN